MIKNSILVNYSNLSQHIKEEFERLGNKKSKSDVLLKTITKVLAIVDQFSCTRWCDTALF